MAKTHRVIAVRHRDGHIVKIRTTDTKGKTTKDWTAAKAIERIDAGQDHFIVANTVWSPVRVVDLDGEPYLRTKKNSSEYSNLENLPEF